MDSCILSDNQSVLSFFSKQPIELKDVINLYNFEFNNNQQETQTNNSKIRLYNNLIDISKENKSNDELNILYNNNYNNYNNNRNSSFDIKLFYKELNTKEFGQHLLYTNVISSTQTILMKHFINSPSQGLTCIADQQTEGRGRPGNTWVSPIGCLLFSFKCKLNDLDKLQSLEYVVGLSIIETIKSLPYGKDLNIKLKWPNDIYTFDEMKNNSPIKICGILIESVNNDIIIGIGLNVSNTNNPKLTINQLIHRNINKNNINNIEDGANIDDIPIYLTRELILSKFFNIFEIAYEEFNKYGFINSSLKKRYIDNWMHSNQIVHLKEQNKTIKILGLESNGYLKAIECDENGNEISNQFVHLHPDDTSFDIENLILKKKEIQQ